MLNDSTGAHTAPNIPTLFGDSSPAATTPAKPAQTSASAAPVVGTTPTAEAAPAPSEPAASATHRERVLAVLVGAGADAKLSVDTIQIDVNVTGGEHLAKGPLEVLLGELAAEGRIVRHDDGSFSLASEERTEREQPGPARAARCAVVTLLLRGGEQVPFDIAQGVLDANQDDGPVVPVAWVDGFTGDLGREDPAPFEARAQHHLDAIVRAGLAAVHVNGAPIPQVPDEPIRVALADSLADVLDTPAPVILRTLGTWRGQDFAAVDAWLKSGEEPAGHDPSTFAEARAAWFATIPPVLVPFTKPEDVKGGIAIPEPGSDTPPVEVRSYSLTRAALVLAVEQGVEALVRKSYGDLGVPTVAELTERFDALLTDATRRARAEGEASLKTWQDLASRAQIDLTNERLVTADYERWFRSKNVQDPRAAIARVFGKSDVFEVEDFEETREVSGDELHRIIAEWEALQELLKAVLAKNAVDKAAMKTAELELVGKVEALAQAIKLAGRGRHVVKKKIRRTIRDGFELILSADEHDAGTELARHLLPQGGPWQQVAIPNAAKAGEPEWTPPAKPVAPAAAVETAPTTAPTEATAAPQKPAEPPVDEEPPAWTGDTALTLGNLRHMLVGIPGKPGLGLFQTSIGAQGILREEVADKLASYIGHASVDDSFIKLVSKTLNATERAGDLFSGFRDGKGLVWHKDVPTPADVLPSEETAKALAATAPKVEKPSKGEAAKKATAERPKAPPKKGAAKKAADKPAPRASRDKGRSGKAGARK